MRDTDPRTEQRFAEAWLERSPGERLEWVFDLNETVAWLAEAGRRMRTVQTDFFVEPERVGFRLGNEVSQRQWGDALGVIRVQGKRLDRDYLDRAAEDAGLADLLKRAYAEGETARPT